MLKVYSLPILKDNYVHLPVDTATGECVIVDPGVAGPVQEFILAEKLKPQAVFCTHHHWDHIGGAQELQKSFQVEVYAPEKEQRDIPFADHYLSEGLKVQKLGGEFQVLELPGHTRGHIAYWHPVKKWLFSGDVLFGLGCGRVFDGTIEDHYASLQKIKGLLPPDTEIYCTHEYTEANLRFCQEKLGLAEDPALKAFAHRVHELRRQGKATVPLLLAQELALNPFLKAPNFASFRSLREQRNMF